MWTSKIIRGERAFNDFMARFRPGRTVYWEGCIGHCDDVRVELLYEMNPQLDDAYKPYYWLAIDMGVGKGDFNDFASERSKIHEDIRAGRIH